MQRLVLWTILAQLAAVGVYVGLVSTGGNEPDSGAQGQTTQPEGSAPPATTNHIGSEPAPAKTAFCPVPMPERTPESLASTLAFLGKPSPSSPMPAVILQLNELMALAQKPLNKEAAEALRWFIHQSNQAEVLRHEALIVLGAWGDSLEWLSGDLTRMLKDPAQSAVWRAYAAQHLGAHYTRHKDEESFVALDEAAGSDDRPVRDQAVYTLAALSKELDLRATDPARFAKFSARLNAILADSKRGDGEAQASSTMVSALRSAALAGMKEYAESVEHLAADDKQAMEVRVAAVQALGAIGRTESVPGLEVCARSKEKTLAHFAHISLSMLRATTEK